MPHRTVYNESIGIIETTLSGLVKAEEVVEIMKDCVALALQFNCFDWINDFSGASHHISITDAYEFPKKMAQLAQELGDNQYRVHRAVVDREIDQTEAFAVTATRNQGQTLGTFRSLEEARAWLIAQRGNRA